MRHSTTPSSQPLLRRKPTRAKHTSDMKKLPEFKAEDEERKFWATADSSQYLDWQSARRRKLVHLKPSLRLARERHPRPG